MSAPVDRILGSLRAIVASWFEARLFGLYPYTVDSFDSGSQTVSASPMPSPVELSPVEDLPVRSPKMQFSLSAGEQVLIGFAGGDPGQPFVASLDVASNYAGALPTARQGDQAYVTIWLLPNTGIGAPPGSFVVSIVPGAGAPLQLYGQVSSGSIVAKTQ